MEYIGVFPNIFYIYLVYWQAYDIGMTTTNSLHTVQTHHHPGTIRQSLWSFLKCTCLTALMWKITG